MGGSEILLILLAVLVLFGADKLPEFARSLGKGLREIRKATDEIKNEISKESSSLTNDFSDIRKQALDTSNELNEALHVPDVDMTPNHNSGSFDSYELYKNTESAQASNITESSQVKVEISKPIEKKTAAEKKTRKRAATTSAKKTKKS
jgi:sec-independent protein translocase protein TatA